ncbi:MAG: ATP-binding protein [Patescibacteria group bacterium]
MELYFSLSGLFNAIASTLLGLLVFFKNKHNKVNQTFALFCLSVAVWSYPYIFWSISKTKEEVLLWFQLLHIGASFASITYLHFVASWLDLTKKKLMKIIIITGYLLAIFFASSVFSPYFISDIIPKFFMKFWAVPGVLYHYYLIFFFCYAIYSSYLLIINYNKGTGVKKVQTRYIFIGMILSFVGGSTNYPLWYNINFPPYGNILASSYVVLSAYAIVVHHLMDIKLIMRRYLVYLMSLSIILLLAIAVRYLSELYFSQSAILVDFLILVLSISIFSPLRNYFYRIANKYFFSSLYDSIEVMASISDKLRSTMETEKIYEYISDILTNAFHVKSIGILTYNENAKNYILEYNNNFNALKQKEFIVDEKVNETIKQNRIIIMEEISPQYKNNKFFNLLLKFGVEILAPLNIKDKIIGLIILGKKESGDMYNDEDLQVLKVAGAQMAISMKNCLLYQETKNFNIKLEKEVEKATHDLRKTNEQLKKLDTAKSEFISIASHQLRTPLTIIKDYVAMMLEGDFGEFTYAGRESLEKVFQSNERLIHLVEDLLNISRIESGRLRFNFVKMDLREIANSVVNEASIYAKKRNLKLEYKKSTKALPLVKIDEEKIRQVIMNLVDNAIKYTKQGKVIIEIKLINKQIRFCVTDSGRGIKHEDIINLFKKFFRAEGISLINTEGMGLGLYVARVIIKQHHGKIWAKSAGEGKGSKFCFELPVK